MANKFDWTKIHLVYFALAGFDLIAIASGLGLSEWSKNAHQQTITKLEQINYLRDTGAEIEGLAIKLSVTADKILSNRDSASAKTELAEIETTFNQVFDEAAFSEKIRKKFAPNVPMQIGGNTISSVKKNLSVADLELIENFEKFEKKSKNELNAMINETKVAWLNMGFSSGLEINEHKRKVHEAYRATLYNALATNKTLNSAMHETVKVSEAILIKSTWLQYLVGAAIFLMIALACTYAFFVGKVLKKKYLELQSSHQESMVQTEEIRTINESVSQLNAELAAKMKSLELAQDELIKKGRMEQLGQLTATVAHELRNPLGAVRTSSFLLERKLKDKGLNVESQLQRISHGVTRCDDIITQLLDFSRTNKLVAKEGNLDQWLITAVEELAKQLPAIVQVTCELGLQDQQVPFDGARLQRAVINLISNASEAMVGNAQDPSKIVTTNPHITISTSRLGDAVLISVKDNGPGMSAEILGKIREPLFTTKSFGTGLGIPAVEQIAHQHGGKLTISSEEGLGSTFTLSLPLPISVADAA